MRAKVILLALRYMAKFVLSVAAMATAIFITVAVIKGFTGDTELGFIVVFALMGLVGAFATCYDIAKNKVDNENRDLMEQLARKQ
jgi:peptidoglycan biosynthesis protein MviN/MurJ (putative lipid II flippase)